MIKSLMTTRRFAPLFWCQFFSALNDNFVKNVLVILILYTAGTQGGATLVTLAGALFMAPFFILSALGGEIADKYDKALIARRLKFAELFAAGIAAVGFVLHSVPILMTALFLFGVISALFGPIKYGILPDHLATKEISAGNALVEGGTFLAILAGTVAGGFMAAESSHPAYVAVAMMALALACWLSARLIPATRAGDPSLAITANPWTSTIVLLKDVKQMKRIWDGTLITSWFWLVGAAALSLLPALVKNRIGGTEHVVTLCLTVFAVGIAAGSLLAAKASHNRPNLALVPLGSLLMTIFAACLAWIISALPPAGAPVGPLDVLTSPTGFHLMLGFFGLAVSGGLFVVPAFAAVQTWADPAKRARVIAAGGVVSAAFIVVSGLLVAGLQALDMPIAALFLLLAVGNLVVTYLVCRAWGRDGLRDVAGFIFKMLFRLDIRGLENMPPPGTRMVIAPNHTSLMDGPLLYPILPVEAAFAVDTEISKAWWAKPFMAVIRAYTMDPTRPLAARALINVVKSGEPLVIFPEGRITVTGSLMKVYDGAAMIADKADALVVPIRIEGAQRSYLSYMKSWQIKRSLFPKITVSILPPVKLKVAEELRGRARRLAAGAALQDVMIDAVVQNAALDQTLFQALAAAAKTRDIGLPIVSDPLGSKLGYRKLILAAQVLGRKLEPLAAEGSNIGVLLPNSVGAAVTFFALQSIGRVPAMLNFSAGAANVVSACRTAELKVVLTSRAFIEKGGFAALVAATSEVANIVYLEDVKASVSFKDKLGAWRDGGRPRARHATHDPAVILFTSGSEGKPKGVVLSHRNLLSNAAQTLARVDVNAEDKVFNVLPVFHSFGLTGGLIMPLLAGIPVYFYPSPLHYRIVPELIYQTNASIMFGTDTFLAGYARSAHPYDFRKLRLVVAGAEPVKDRTRQLYMERFGVRILEGYGVTETSPVLAMNTPMANRTGTVGRLSPLMEARLEPLPGIADGGRLMVRGPNVMLGYLRADNPGQIDPPADGWYDTGDIVAIDADGFLTIKGRAKRFAKVAGEMISLAAVEAMAQDLWPDAQHAVVAVPDARKGERLVLVTTQQNAGRAAFQREARAKGASELAVPAEIIALAKLPLLGTGKTDYVAVSGLAKERMGGAATKAA